MPWAPQSRAAIERTKARREASEQRRGNFRERGYSTTWTKLSLAWREEHPLCAECERQGKLEPATCVDHIRPHHGDMDLMYDGANLQSLCNRCHSAKTANEDGGFGRKS